MPVAEVEIPVAEVEIPTAEIVNIYPCEEPISLGCVFLFLPVAHSFLDVFFWSLLLFEFSPILALFDPLSFNGKVAWRFLF